MRLKQLLYILLLATVPCAMAAANSQVTGVSVQAMDHASVITIHANGDLVHNEYRPTDSLLLVDFTGASVGKLDSDVHSVNMPGVASYRVSSYTGARGATVARVEIVLEPHTSLHLQDQPDALSIKVSAAGEKPSATALVQPAPKASNSVVSPIALTEAVSYKPAFDGASISSAKPVRVNGVSVARAQDGINVEIHANGIANPKAMKLGSPDRIVVDLPNAIVAGKPRNIPVNSAGIRMVRMSQYQAVPPVTRVVVDLNAPHDFELAGAQGKWTIALHPAAAKTEIASARTFSGAAATESPKPGALLTAQAIAGKTAAPAAQDLVVVEPGYAPKEKKAGQISQSKSAGERAAQAAKTLGAVPPAEIPLSSTPVTANAAMKPEMAANLMQVGAQPSTIQPQGVQSAVQPLQGSQSAPAAPAQTPTPVPVPVTPAPMPTTGATPVPVQTVRLAQQPIGCNTGRFTGEPISVNLKDVDLKDFFRLIHEISGLNVILDPGVGGSLTLVLDDVPWDQALSIVLNNNGLECELQGNVLRIALPATLKREADARRAAVEAQALAVDKTTVTRYLSYAAAKDVVPTIKQFLSQRGDIISDDRTNGLIISDIPSVIPNIDRLLKELDRKTPEVEIEARVVAATRNFLRDLGTQFSAAFGNSSSFIEGAQTVGSATTQVTSTGQVGGSPRAEPYAINSSGQIPLISNFPAVGATSGLDFFNIGSNHRLEFVLTAAENRGLVKILSRPRVVTQNNISAIVRQGVRIPVVTLGQLGGPPSVQYVDAFLRLQVRPQITAEGTIFLNVDVENTSPDFGHQVSGNPTLLTQQATTQVLVTDGGTVVIGGVIQTQDNVTYDQVPFLGSIPLLGNIFKRKAVSTSTQELIFFLTPKIIQT